MANVQEKPASEARQAPHVESLNQVLSDLQIFYQKLRGYHWNVVGPEFFKLHEKFEELYEFTADQADAVAERVRGLGGRPVATYADQIELATLEEDPGTNQAEQMVQNLLDDIAVLKSVLSDAHDRAESAGDQTTVNLLEDTTDELENHRWMLEAFLS